ncbi:unnamed protein product [Oreochromis niloticus]|nr:unnamed protein product [Mustela putorius furo]
MIAVFVFLIPVLWFTGTQGAVSFWPLAVRDGNKVTLHCSDDSCNSTTWSFKGLGPGAEEVELFNQGQEKATSDRLSVDTNCSLVIHKVTVEDAGHYTCMVADKTRRTPGLLLDIDFAVVVMTEEKYGDKVTLICSVWAENCQQNKVNWHHNSVGINIYNPYIKISQSSCFAYLTILNTNSSNISSYDFMCGVTIYDNRVELFAFSPHSTGEKTNSKTASKSIANTVTEKKSGEMGPLNSSISVLENCELAKVKWIHNSTVWCRFIIVVVSLAALIAVVVMVNILTKAVPKAKMDGNMVYNEEDDGAAKRENVQPSEEV